MINPRYCKHKNISWSELFKKEKNVSNEAHCVDCGASKGESTSKAIQRWYCDKVDEWLQQNGSEGIKGRYDADWINLLKEQDGNFYKEFWLKACSSTIDPNHFEGFGGQMLFIEFAKSIECLLDEWVKMKEAKKNTSQSTPTPKKNRKKNKNNQDNQTPNQDNPQEEIPQQPNTPSPNSNNQREQIQQQISELENKPNRTPSEEQDLINKKKI